MATLQKPTEKGGNAAHVAGVVPRFLCEYFSLYFSSLRTVGTSHLSIAKTQMVTMYKKEKTMGGIARVLGITEKAVSVWVRCVDFSNLNQSLARKEAQADREKPKLRLIDRENMR